MKSFPIDSYADILNLVHPVSKNHPPMPRLDRAAQFAPFAALTGHSAAIAETARYTDAQVDPDETLRQLLDEKLQLLLSPSGRDVLASFTYFVPDSKKEGGAYATRTGKIKKLLPNPPALILQDDTRILLKDILDIESDFFCSLDALFL